MPRFQATLLRSVMEVGTVTIFAENIDAAYDKAALMAAENNPSITWTPDFPEFHLSDTDIEELQP